MILKASAFKRVLGRIGRADEVAQVITWLVSDPGSWVTGQVIGIDGGLSSIRSKAAGEVR